MPSAVLVTDDGIKVGTEAVRAQRLFPQGFAESPKLLLGLDTVLLADRDIEVVDLVAAVLRHAADKAMRAAGGRPPDRVLLTHPYEWAGPRKAALREAWHRTGIPAPTVALVSEPIAAASWFAATAPPPAGSHVAVVDIGGGTCDVAVVQVTGDAAQPLRVTGHGGQDDLGGRAVDQILTAYVRSTLVQIGRTDLDRALSLPENLGAARTLQEQVRQAKHALAEYEDASIPVVVGSQETTLKLTSAELVHLVDPVVARIRDLTVRTVQQAGMRPADLHALYLTGGSSHLRPVASMMAGLLDRLPATVDDPKTVVCLGSQYAGHLATWHEPVVTPGPVEGTQPPPADGPATSPTDPPPETQQVHTKKPGRSRARWALPAVIVAVVLAGWVVAAVPPDSPGPTEPTTGPTEEPTEAPTAEPTSGPNAAETQLLALVPPDAGDCEPYDGSQGGSIAMVYCKAEFTDASSQTQQMDGWYSLFADEQSMDAFYEEDIGPGILAAEASCPDVPGSTTYTIVAPETVEGRVACFNTSNDAGPYASVTWTRDSALVVGELLGPYNGDLASTWDFWINRGAIGTP